MNESGKTYDRNGNVISERLWGNPSACTIDEKELAKQKKQQKSNAYARAIFTTPFFVLSVPFRAIASIPLLVRIYLAPVLEVIHWILSLGGWLIGGGAFLFFLMCPAYLNYIELDADGFFQAFLVAMQNGIFKNLFSGFKFWFIPYGVLLIVVCIVSEFIALAIVDKIVPKDDITGDYLFYTDINALEDARFKLWKIWHPEKLTNAYDILLHRSALNEHIARARKRREIYKKKHPEK